MAKERLSKLQKWILKECYKKSRYRMERVEIFSGFYGWKPILRKTWPLTRKSHGFQKKVLKKPIGGLKTISKDYNKAQTTVTRSLRTLLGHGYIKGYARYDCELQIYDDDTPTKSDKIQKQFKEYQEAHNITWEEWCKQHKRVLPLMSDPEGSYKDYRDAHPDIPFNDWYHKRPSKPNLLGRRPSLAKLYKYEPEKSERNIKSIELTEKGIKKAQELLNVN